MKLMIASDIHGSSYFCREMLAAFQKEQADRVSVRLIMPQSSIKCSLFGIEN